MYRRVLPLLLTAVLLLSGCTAGQKNMPQKTDEKEMTGQPSDMSGEGSMYMDTTENVIYLAGGCFWGMEHLMQSIPGVIDAESGYANGTCEADADYKTVCKGETGFREAVRVEYDPGQVSLDALLLAYFYVIDPTVENRQGNDRGSQYQTGVYYTNVDHCFQKAGIEKNRLFYTQGDYGLFQCSKPCHNKTYDNESAIRDMVLSQGFKIDVNGNLLIPFDKELKIAIPTGLLPHCPVCGKPMALNLRSDNTFVQDEGWYFAADHYEQFLETNLKKKIIFLEIGVGYNSPGIIKYPFWRYTAENWNAFYICINNGQTMIPKEISDRSICIDGDAAEIIQYARAYQNKI